MFNFYLLIIPLDIIYQKYYRKKVINKIKWERWVSGLNQQFAKLPKGAILSVGSNPTLSAKIKYYV